MISFSNKKKYSGQITFSPNSQYFALNKELVLLIYNSKTLELICKFFFNDLIQDIQWSPDSSLILIGLYKSGIVQVKKLNNSFWICEINEGIKGIKYARFSPDSEHVITISELNVKMTIRSLLDKSTYFIKCPKFAKKGIDFTKNNKFMILAEKNGINDCVGFYYLTNWLCIKRFDTQTEDLQDIKWSYDNSTIIVQDLNKILIYSPMGKLKKIYEDKTNPYNLYIKNIIINKRYLFISCYNQSLQLLNYPNFVLVKLLDHDPESLPEHKINFFKEEIINNDFRKTKYIEMPYTTSLRQEIYNFQKVKDTKNHKFGISLISFSYDNKFLCTKNENVPNVLFIWDMNSLQLYTVLIQINNISDMKWAKNENILHITTNNNKLYIYTIDSCKIIEMDESLRLNSLIFNSDGDQIILKDNQYFVLANKNGFQEKSNTEDTEKNEYEIVNDSVQQINQQNQLISIDINKDIQPIIDNNLKKYPISNFLPNIIMSSLDMNLNLLFQNENVPLFLGYYIAYKNHYPISINPDHLWLLIVQAFCYHLKANLNKFNDIFNNNQKLIVEYPLNNLEELNIKDADNLAEQVNNQLYNFFGEDLMNILTPEFSTTNNITEFICKINIMGLNEKLNNNKINLNYDKNQIGCIPNIIFEGVVSDYEKLIQKTNELSGFDFEWFTENIIYDLKMILNSLNGNVESDFFKNFINVVEDVEAKKNGLQKYNITGWLLHFFPYNDNGECVYNEKFDINEIPNFANQMMVVPFDIVNSNNKEMIYNLKFGIGFMGVEQDEKDYKINPVCGWYISNL